MLDKNARLRSIMSAIDELKEKEEQAIYGAEISIKSREYNRLEVCAGLLMAAYRQKKLLLNEAKDLQEQIEKESAEEFL